MDLKKLLEFNPTGETIIALAIVAVLIIFAIVIGIKAKHADPLKRPKGILLLAEWAVEKLDGFVADIMGDGFENFGGVLLGIIPFLFLSFTIGITGLPTPMANLAVPLTLSLVTFFMIHFTAARYNKWRYFKRYIEPLPVFLPVNLVSMWAPLISMTLRMFGNAIVGWVLMSLVNWALGNASAAIFSALPSGVNTIFLTPILTPVLHAYFDLFSGFVQSMVFIFLTVLFIAQEKPEPVEQEIALAIRKENN